MRHTSLELALNKGPHARPFCLGSADKQDARGPNAVDFCSHMNEQIESLIRLQAVELERNRLAAEAKALPIEVANAAAALQTAQHKAADAINAMSREESLRARLDKEIASLQQKTAHVRTQLDSVSNTTQASAIEHELNFAQLELARLEDEGMASLERTEALETELAVIRQSVETLAGALEKTELRFKTRLAENRSDMKALDSERAALRTLIDPEPLVRFDRISFSRGTGLARAERQQCNGCRMGIRPQVWNQLREGQLLVCDSCNRLLYWDPTLVPADAPVTTHGDSAKKPKSSPALKIPGAQAS